MGSYKCLHDYYYYGNHVSSVSLGLLYSILDHSYPELASPLPPPLFTFDLFDTGLNYFCHVVFLFNVFSMFSAVTSECHLLWMGHGSAKLINGCQIPGASLFRLCL